MQVVALKTIIHLPRSLIWKCSIFSDGVYKLLVFLNVFPRFSKKKLREGAHRDWSLEPISFEFPGTSQEDLQGKSFLLGSQGTSRGGCVPGEPLRIPFGGIFLEHEREDSPLKNPYY